MGEHTDLTGRLDSLRFHEAHWGVNAIVGGFLLFCCAATICHEDTRPERLFRSAWRGWSAVRA